MISCAKHCARRSLLGVLCLLLAIVAAGALAREPPGETRALPARLEQSVVVDFDGMLERRAVRVAAPYSRTLYFNDNGREGGLSADFVQDFERWINQKYERQLRGRPITVVIRPTRRDALLTDVAEGLADIGVGDLTATDERTKVVDFVPAEGVLAVSELVLTGPKSLPIASADDLSGRAVHVRKSSNAYQSLVELNDHLKDAGKPPVNLVLVPDALEDKDSMEMLNAGLFQAIVVDDWMAHMWAPVLPRIRVSETAVVHAGGKIGWAIRKNSPQLTAVLNEFYTRFLERQRAVQARMKEYSRRVTKLKDPADSSARKRFEDTLALFREYGGEYHFDALMLAAQGYQESQLNQQARSRVGAIGIMQLMPATGAALHVGNIRNVEPNVHAGAKYMDQLLARYLGDATFDETNRTLFALACYNAGPGNIERMRGGAEKRGLDADKWFNNVEIITAEKIGTETTTYVRNIYKYYVAYKLMLEMEARNQTAREAVKQGQ
jgi:membrane-bound lytic murein transglycosylase MltF